MYFEVRDGKAVFATHKIIGKVLDKELQVQKEVIDGETIEYTVEVEVEKDFVGYAFSEDELSKITSKLTAFTVYELEPPSTEILAKAKSLDGKALSKSKFEKLLFSSDADIEQRVSDIEDAIVSIVGGNINSVRPHIKTSLIARVVKRRATIEQRSIDVILSEYPNLSYEERNAVLKAITTEVV